MAHSTIHTDTAKESTLLALTEYECISARACERRGTEWGTRVTTCDEAKTRPAKTARASRSEVIGGARPSMRRGAALALALALLAAVINSLFDTIAEMRKSTEAAAEAAATERTAAALPLLVDARLPESYRHRRHRLRKDTRRDTRRSWTWRGTRFMRCNGATSEISEWVIR